MDLLYICFSFDDRQIGLFIGKYHLVLYRPHRHRSLLPVSRYRLGRELRSRGVCGRRRGMRRIDLRAVQGQ